MCTTKIMWHVEQSHTPAQFSLPKGHSLAFSHLVVQLLCKNLRFVSLSFCWQPLQWRWLLFLSFFWLAILTHCADEIFRKTGLVKVRRLTKELAWFSSQGYAIPEAGPAGIVDANHLMDLSQTNAPAFISHLHNVCHALSAGDQFLVQKVCASKCS